MIEQLTQPAGFFLGARVSGSYSYLRQHINRPHIPEIFEGLSESPCALAILIEIGSNPLRKVEQHRERPHGP